MKLKKQSFSNKMKGGEFIPTYTETSPGWHNANSNVPFAVDLNAGVNEYVFSRTTPNNKFVVSTGLINTESGIEMVGGKINKKIKKPLKKVKLLKEKSSTSKLSKAKSTVAKLPKEKLAKAKLTVAKLPKAKSNKTEPVKKTIINRIKNIFTTK